MPRRRTILFVILLLAARSLHAGRPTTVPPDALARFRASLDSAHTLHIYEGLPHQTFDRVALRQERRRKDVTTIAGFPFYTPATPSRFQPKLKSLLARTAAIRLYVDDPLLRCGGFHPDFAIVWKAQGKTHAVSSAPAAAWTCITSIIAN